MAVIGALALTAGRTLLSMRATGMKAIFRSTIA